MAALVPISLVSKKRNAIYGICALWIVGLHAVNLFQIDMSFGTFLLKPFAFFLSQDLAVDVFLILSGLSCYYSYSSNPDAGSFFRHRVARIWPALILTYGLSWLISVSLGKMDLLRYLYYVSLTPFFSEGNANGAWYFSFILLMYLCFPYFYELIFRRTHGNRMVYVNLILVTSCSALIYWLTHKYALSTFNQVEIGLARVPTFIVGCYLGYLSKKGYSLSVQGLLCSLFVVALWASFYYSFVVPHHFWWGRLFFSLGGGLASTALLVAILAFLEKIFGSIGHNIKIGFEKIGSYSLELYASHLVLFYGMLPGVPVLEQGNMPQCLIYSIMALLYSWICVRFLEPALLIVIRRLATFRTMLNSE